MYGCLQITMDCSAAAGIRTIAQECFAGNMLTERVVVELKITNDGLHTVILQCDLAEDGIELMQSFEQTFARKSSYRHCSVLTVADLVH